MDVAGLKVGAEYPKQIEDALQKSRVLLVIIGPNWMELLREKQSDGERDFVIEEISRALVQSTIIIPVLVEGASLPDSKLLPENIRGVVDWQKHVLQYESFSSDLDKLVQIVEGRGIKRKNKSLVFSSTSQSVAALVASMAIIAGGLYFYFDSKLSEKQTISEILQFQRASSERQVAAQKELRKRVDAAEAKFEEAKAASEMAELEGTAADMKVRQQEHAKVKEAQAAFARAEQARVRAKEASERAARERAELEIAKAELERKKKALLKAERERLERERALEVAKQRRQAELREEWYRIYDSTDQRILKDFYGRAEGTEFAALADSRLSEIRNVERRPRKPKLSSMSKCDRLWVARNRVFHRLKYCFKTDRAIQYFGNNGCHRTRKEVTRVMSKSQRDRVNTLLKAECRNGCKGSC